MSPRLRLQLLRQRVIDALDLRRPTLRGIDTSSVKTVCLMLGPQRNLTTVTASALFLHPHCQVLNHAGARIFGTRHDPLPRRYSKSRFDDFIQFAVRISANGQRGTIGGSITKSHVFDAPDGHVGAAFDRMGGVRVKPQIRCLMWKEPRVVLSVIRDRAIDVGDLLACEPRLVFLMPVRNPLDCMESNVRNNIGLYRGAADFPRHGVWRRSADASHREYVLKSILDDIHWFAVQAQRSPSRFHLFFEDDLAAGRRQMVLDISAHLRLPPDDAWLETAQQAFYAPRAYRHEPRLVSMFADGVSSTFSAMPIIRDRLLALAGTTS